MVRFGLDEVGLDVTADFAGRTMSGGQDPDPLGRSNKDSPNARKDSNYDGKTSSLGCAS